MPKLFINPTTAARLAIARCCANPGLSYTVTPRRQKNSDGSHDIGFIAAFTDAHGFPAGVL